jgi:hypothetical protein
MAQTVPALGDDVTALMGGGGTPAPPVGADVTHLMGDAPNFSAQSVPAVQTFGEQALSGVKDFTGELQSLNPKAINTFVQSAFWHPIDTAKGVLSAQDQMRVQAMDAFKKGDAVTGTARLVEWLIPFIGPRLAQAGDAFQRGETAKGLGATVDAALPVILPEIVKQIGVKTPGVVASKLTPEEAASNALAEQRGVPLDAATATGSKFMRAAEKRVANTMGGEGTADALIGKQQQALTRVGGELADDAHPTTISREGAGQSVRDALTQKVQGHASDAEAAYGTVEQTATQKNLTVDTKNVKQMLTPLYQSLKREAELVPASVMGDKARALTAIDRLMSAPAAVPLMDAENALGALKGLSRLKDGQIDAMRTPGQGAASVAVKQLQSAVDTAAMRGGVLKDLQSGRAATAAKFDTNGVLDSLTGDEPVSAFKQLTRPKDESINLLRTVTKHTPQVGPEIARGYLEDLLNQATERGRFDHADKLYADWQKLGTQTKQILFPQPGQRQALDAFFLLAKRVAENPNPSGTAHTLTALNVASQPLAWSLSKLLYTPTGVQLLTRGLTLSLSGQKAAAALQFARAADLLKGGGMGLPMPAVTRSPTSETTR